MRKLLLAGMAAFVASSPATAQVFTDTFDTPGSFTSSYQFIPNTSGGNTAAGQYTVANNAFDWNTNFKSYGDHTTGTGKFMVVNGAGLPEAVWSNATGILLNPGTYNFSFALSDACCNTGFNNGSDPSPPALGLTFRSGSTRANAATPFGGTFSLAPGTQAGVWQVLGASFTVTATDTYFFSIMNQNTQSAGNDFGLDDIKIAAAVPESSTWAMLILGFGAVGAAARRRSKARLGTRAV